MSETRHESPGQGGPAPGMSERTHGMKRSGCASVPATTVQRLPLYLRALLEAQTQRIQVMNSVGIAERAGTNAAQVRKDLSFLGELGTRGIGYDVDSLASHLSRFLGLTRTRRAVIAGFGRLGSALLSYPGFADRGFEVVSAVDADEAKVGLRAGGLEVRHVSELPRIVTEQDVEILVLTTPAAKAQEVASEAVKAGVRAVLNFAPVRLSLPSEIAVRQADLSSELQILSFHLACREERDGQER